MSADDRTYLATDDALAALDWQDDDGRQVVHTFRGGGSIMIGADLDRDTVVRYFTDYRPEVLGPTARALGHGIGVLDDRGLIGFATREEALAALEAPNA